MKMTWKLNIDNGLQDQSKEHQAVTKCSSSKGFSGKLNILPRSNFGGGGQGSSPQSLTAATLNRYRALKPRTPVFTTFEKKYQ
jgi:hypothetical protein